MSLRQNGAPYTNGQSAARAPGDDSDVEEETLANDYQEQMQYDEDAIDDGMDDGMAFGSTQQDIQATLQTAVTPLERDASLETKFISYDNYCSLFHYILNSDGPVDLEMPSVGGHGSC